MSKLEWAVAGIITIVLLVVSIGIYQFKEKEGGAFLGAVLNANTEAEIPQPPEPKEQEPQPDITYEDEAGFSFKHPQSITVIDNTPEDGIHYTLLSLRKEATEGIKIVMKDTNSKDLDEWLKESIDAPQNPTLIGAVSLDGVSARQYKSNGNLLTLAIDQKVLYKIQGPKDGDYWEKVHEILVSTFKFAKPEQPQNSTAPASSTIYEEETVIE